MSNEWDEKSVFLQALDKAPAELDAYLDQACQSESQRARILELLAGHEQGLETVFRFDAPDAEPAQTPAQIDEFLILEEVGRGGMGVVYLAEDTRLGRRVALKLLAPHLAESSDALGRFRNEARSAAKLRHPAIVPVYKSGRDRGREYIVSEFVEGMTLTQVLDQEAARRRKAVVPARQDWYRFSAESVAAVADALDHSHRLGVIHRDVKPSNILVDRANGPRLTDFGVAKLVAEGTKTLSGSLLGSCHYMSPEQASTAVRSVDFRSDVFSLGVVLYELLSLRRPFEGDDHLAVIRRVIECEPAWLRSLDPAIPADLVTIAHKAMEKRPVDRYQSAAHIAADLRSFLAGDPILAKPPTLVRRIQRAVGRYQMMLFGLTLLVSGVAAGTFWPEAPPQASVQIDVSPPGSGTLTLHTLEAAAAGAQIKERVTEPRRTLALRNGSARLRLPKGTYWLVVQRPNGQFCERPLLVEDDRPQSVRIQLDTPLNLARDLIEIPAQGASPAFWIERCEVSNGRYAAFLDSLPPSMRQRYRPRHWNANAWKIPGWTDLPVVGVTWEAAAAFASSQGMRLPSESEWKRAVAGVEERAFPWGDEQLVPQCVANAGDVGADPFLTTHNPDVAELLARYQRGVIPVNAVTHARDRSCEMASVTDTTSEGVLQLYGNVLEWTATPAPVFSAGDKTVRLVVKGKAWQSQPGQGTDLMDQRIEMPSRTERLGLGFRCVRPTRPRATASGES